MLETHTAGSHGGHPPYCGDPVGVSRIGEAGNPPSGQNLKRYRVFTKRQAWPCVLKYTLPFNLYNLPMGCCDVTQEYILPVSRFFLNAGMSFVIRKKLISHPSSC